MIHAPAPIRRHQRRRAPCDGGRVGAEATKPSRPRAAVGPVRDVVGRIRGPPETRRVEPAPATDNAPVFRTMDAIRTRARSGARERRQGVRRRDRRRGRRQRVRAHRGLRERFADRVRDTPISETAIVGLGVGAAMAGMRRWSRSCISTSSRMPRSVQPGGEAAVHDRRARPDGAHRPNPVRRRTLLGQPALAESRSAACAHFGLTVVMPSTPADTYGLLRAAIRIPTRSCSSRTGSATG